MAVSTLLYPGDADWLKAGVASYRGGFDDGHYWFDIDNHGIRLELGECSFFLSRFLFHK
jgi:hypothetical protein